MSESTGADRNRGGPLPAVGESHADFRQRMNLIQAEAKERRQHELGEQCSPRNAPADRIRIWERLHQLQMPLKGSHRLLSIIAANTGLSLEDVRAEQHARATRTTAPVR